MWRWRCGSLGCRRLEYDKPPRCGSRLHGCLLTARGHERLRLIRRRLALPCQTAPVSVPGAPQQTCSLAPGGHNRTCRRPAPVTVWRRTVSRRTPVPVHVHSGLQRRGRACPPCNRKANSTAARMAGEAAPTDSRTQRCSPHKRSLSLPTALAAHKQPQGRTPTGTILGRLPENTGSPKW